MPGCARFEVAVIRFIPKGFKLLAGDKRSAITGTCANRIVYPGGITAEPLLESLRDTLRLFSVSGGVRCARPPANGWYPFGMENYAASKCARQYRSFHFRGQLV